tara:strand:- start:22064 stop:23551 length:1488 start_codon:yes stop_codon:yes gene_type:complete
MIIRQLYISAIFVLTLGSLLHAQNENDVLRYSTTDVFGSARVEAMAGSFGALGADLSVVNINPAGLGRFSKSDVSISLNNNYIETFGTYNGTTVGVNNNNFVINNAGVVITNDISQENTGRKYSQFTISYNRLKNFNYQRKYEGQNFYSLLDVFANIGEGIAPPAIYDERPFTTGLAYDVFALDYDQSNGVYTSRLTMGDNYHERLINSEGGMGDFSISYSENYMNQFYYGGSIGFRRVNYYQSYDHTETLLDTVGTSLRSFNYMYEQETQGVGLNLKLGLIYLPVDEVRLGLSYESPTILSLEDNWTADMTATHDDGIKYIEPQFVPKGNFSYNMTTPMKVRGSFAYIINLRGAINVDLEVARYGQGKLRPDQSQNSFNPYGFEIENAEVNNQFRTVLNTRIGFEYMILRDFFIRAGYAYLPQPYKPEVGNIMKGNQTFSGGIGWENDWFKIDASYRQTTLNYDYYAFDPSKIENRTRFQSTLHNIVISAGLKL